ncbi:MAG: glycosyltransferase family 1 protein [Dokdonella sp.]|nr:glycosyltransferase family 4 protein [Dokdonella sp.]MCB1573393.1 glycosyltransferase family 4 protein [Xanthomonadales bacterium]
MRVIFNVDAISAPLTGIGRYALELAQGLAQHAAIEELRLYSAVRWVEDPADALRSNRLFASLRQNLPFKTRALEAYSRVRNVLFRAHTRKLRGFLLHTPNYILMPFDGPAVTTVHDLSAFNYPDTHPPERVRFLERHLPATLERAQRVITDSTFIAAELHAKLGVPHEKLRVVALGVDPRYRPHADHELAEALSRHGLARGAYLLVVATQEPRKNLVRLARAYAALPPPLRARHPLVIVGARGWLSAELEKALAPLEASGAARRLGYVSEADLPLIYAGAHAFAFPSLYEGFGLPVLEALASGIPVLTSNVSSLPEICADTALCVDPLDESALRDGLERLLEDEAWRGASAARGLQHAAAFPWSRCVDETVAVYRELVAPDR